MTLLGNQPLKQMQKSNYEKKAKLLPLSEHGEEMANGNLRGCSRKMLLDTLDCNQLMDDSWKESEKAS